MPTFQPEGGRRPPATPGAWTPAPATTVRSTGSMAFDPVQPRGGEDQLARPRDRAADEAREPAAGRWERRGGRRAAPAPRPPPSCRASARGRSRRDWRRPSRGPSRERLAGPQVGGPRRAVRASRKPGGSAVSAIGAISGNKRGPDRSSQFGRVDLDQERALRGRRRDAHRRVVVPKDEGVVGLERAGVVVGRLERKRSERRRTVQRTLGRIVRRPSTARRRTRCSNAARRVITLRSRIGRRRDARASARRRGAQGVRCRVSARASPRPRCREPSPPFEEGGRACGPIPAKTEKARPPRPAPSRRARRRWRGRPPAGGRRVRSSRRRRSSRNALVGLGFQDAHGGLAQLPRMPGRRRPLSRAQSRAMS